MPRTEAELGPYRAQVQARAVENRVFILHANACGNPTDMAAGSHGRSRVLSPTGVVLAEGGIETEEIVTAALSVEEREGATALYARKSLLETCTHSSTAALSDLCKSF